MQDLLTIAGLGILIYLIYKDKQKEKEYKENQNNNKEWIYNPKTKSFVENQQSKESDRTSRNVQNEQNSGEYHYKYKSAHEEPKAQPRIQYRPQQQNTQYYKPSNETKHHNQAQEQTKTVNEQSGIYYARPLLTAHEMQAYSRLKPEADKRGFVICPKVRLADLVHPYSNDPKYMAHFGRIKAKHVDFVICDQLMNVQGIIELDDRSHNRKDRQERDQLVDDILSSVGYKVIHTREISPNILDNFIKQ